MVNMIYTNVSINCTTVILLDVSYQIMSQDHGLINKVV